MAPRLTWFSKRLVLLLPLALLLAGPGTASGGDPADLETDFRQFLDTYVGQIKAGNEGFLGTVHPDLPDEMYRFFIDATRSMMRYADEKGLNPGITCRPYNICKATWPQPDDSWAAQTFIRYEGKWLWLQP